MIITILVLFIIIIAAALGGAIWFVFHARRSAQGKKTSREAVTVGSLPFRWSYIILPVAILLLSILLSAYFYHRLPTEVATHFKLNGTPDGWLSRGMTMVWVLTPQFFLALLALAITWGISKLSILLRQAQSTWERSGRILSFMGNIVALPQLVICFAMLDIFSYNSYQTHIMPLWLFLIFILGLATFAIGLFFILVMLKAKRQSISQPIQRNKER